jgi:hypothetical protein
MLPGVNGHGVVQVPMPDDGSTDSGEAVDIEVVSMVLVMRVNQGEENESWEDDDEVKFIGSRIKKRRKPLFSPFFLFSKKENP